MLGLTKTRKNEKGIAAIVVVSILVILLSLVSIGFSRLTNRDLSQSVEDQKGKVASYAAESGINEVINLIKNGQNIANQNSCQGSNPLLTQLNSNKGLSKDNQTEYTCVLLNRSPKSLVYSGVNAMSTQTVRIQPGTTLSSLLVSWRSATGNNNFANATKHLPSESTWGPVTPMMRLSVYSVPGNNSLSPAQGFATSTYFLYPSKSGTTTVTVSGPGTTQNASLVNINCRSNNLNPYQLPGNNYCSAIIKGLPNGSDPNATYYLDLTPIYGSSDITIQGYSAANSQVIAFGGTQMVIDVTAKSNDVVKRLQAHVDSTGLNQNNSESPIALRSATTICKRYVVNGSSLSISSAYPSICGTNSAPPPPPPPNGNHSKIVTAVISGIDAENASVQIQVLGVKKGGGSYICTTSPMRPLNGYPFFTLTADASNCPDNEINNVASVLIVYNNGDCVPTTNPYDCVYHHTELESVSYAFNKAPAKPVRYFSNNGACLPGKGNGPSGPYNITCGTVPYVLNGGGTLTFKTTDP